MTEITYQTTAEDIASRSIHVTVPVEHLKEAEQKVLRQYTKSLRLPGFRKGQAPAAMIRKRFGADIQRHLLEDSLRESWEKVLKETALQPIADPQISNVSMEADQPLEFDLTIEIRPELKLETVGGFTLQKTNRSITEEAVDEQLQQLREQQALWQPAEGQQPVSGTLVNVTVTALEEGAEAGAPYEFVIGEGRAVADLEEKIMTMRTGETIETEIRYPDDHPDQSRRGTSRAVRISLHDVKVKSLPELDDAFAREVAGGRFDDLAALRLTVRQDLEAEAVRTAEQELQQQLINQIAEANQVPAPHGMTHRLMHAYAESYGIGHDQLAAFEQSFQSVAENQVRRELILDAVATARNLRADESAVDARVAELATARGVEPGALYASLQKGNRLGELERSLTEERVFKWLLEQSTVTEVSA